MPPTDYPHRLEAFTPAERARLLRLRQRIAAGYYGSAHTPPQFLDALEEPDPVLLAWITGVGISLAIAVPTLARIVSPS
jgi:hypothetical protein